MRHLALLALLAGCSAAPEPTEAPPAEPVTAATATVEGAATPDELMGDVGLELSLDGDAKWPLDPHTREVLADIRSELAAAPLTSSEEATALRASLGAHMTKLVQGCTMEGPAHDELHVFLMAWFPAVARLEGADAAAATVVRDELVALIAELDATFM